MKTDYTDRERAESPIASLLGGNQITSGQKAGVWVGIVLTACAVAVFIWLIVKAAQVGDARGIVMMSSFILFAFGFLYFLLARINNPKRAWIVLYVTIPLAVAAFVVSLYLDNGSTAPSRDLQKARATEALYGVTDGTEILNIGDLN